MTVSPGQNATNKPYYYSALILQIYEKKRFLCVLLFRFQGPDGSSLSEPCVSPTVSPIKLQILAKKV